MVISEATTRFRVLLIDPPEVSGGYNVGLAYLASSARHAGHHVEVLDLNAAPAGARDKIKRAVGNKDYVGISVHSFSAQHAARETAQLVKKYNSSCVLLVGGPHITLDGRRFLEECPAADIAVIGDGELALVDILAQRSLQAIPGLIFREGNGIIVNPARNEITDLDSLPYPDYSVFDSRERMESHFTVTSRGCPYQCTYCAVPMINGRRWRFRSVENIIDEIRSVAQDYDRFAIIDDTFTQRLSRAKRFCEEYIKSGIGLTWSCPCGIRADRLDEELVSLMKRAGCTRVALGIETLDENVFASLNKGEKVGAVLDAIRLLKKYEIQVSALLIIGLPGSTYEKDKYTVETARNLNIDSLVNIFAPYPGTAAANIVSNGAGFEFVEDIRTAVPLPRSQPQVFVSSQEYDYREVEKMYYYANLRLGDYEPFLDPHATSVVRAVKLACLVLKYDPFHVLGHLGYMTKKLVKRQSFYHLLRGPYSREHGVR